MGDADAGRGRRHVHAAGEGGPGQGGGHERWRPPPARRTPPAGGRRVAGTLAAASSVRLVGAVAEHGPSGLDLGGAGRTRRGEGLEGLDELVGASLASRLTPASAMRAVFSRP